MTDETRAELRSGIEECVRRALCSNRTHVIVNTVDFVAQRFTLTVFKRDESVELPPLTPAQVLALSVLVGEPDSVIESALCDAVLDQGHEYATACYDRGKAEERERCVCVLHERATVYREYGEIDTTAVLRNTALLLMSDDPPG